MHPHTPSAPPHVLAVAACEEDVLETVGRGRRLGASGFPHAEPCPIPRSPRSMPDVAAGGVPAREEEGFGERELEVAANLVDLSSIVRACNCLHRQQQKQNARLEIPSWGRGRPRRAPASLPAEKPAAAIDDDSGKSEGVARPDTPLAFLEDGKHDEATEATATEDAAAKACAQDKVSRRAARSAPAHPSANPFRLDSSFLLLDGRSWAEESGDRGCVTRMEGIKI
ncbi:hypothetical protein D1007_50124 [Hordeum vulgare]|nr:hypothetical protein D1007_50124 [Hordeum vulgare]